VTRVVIPDGAVIDPRALSGGDPLTGSRQTTYRFDLLDNAGKKFGELDGVQGGTVDWTSDTLVKGGGSITLDARQLQPISWLRTRIRPVMLNHGLPDQPCGVFIPSAPSQEWTASGGTVQVELLDRTSVLDQDVVHQSYSVAKSTNIVTAITDLIASTGERVGSITPVDAALAADLVWPAGTSKLAIANDMLKSAGCFALRADLYGQFIVEPYRTPGSRPVTYEFLDDSHSVYLPTHGIDDDIYSVPNRVIAIAPGTGDTEGVIGIATNENPDSPFSYQARGRWVTKVETNVEIPEGSTPTAVQELVDNAAKLSLSKATPSKTLTIQHGPIPGLELNDVVRFRRTEAGIDGLFTIASTGIDFQTTALASSKLVEVVDLDAPNTDFPEV
jgi:hypothetical protein